MKVDLEEEEVITMIDEVIPHGDLVTAIKEEKIAEIHGVMIVETGIISIEGPIMIEIIGITALQGNLLNNVLAFII